MKFHTSHFSRAFTLVEVIVGAAVFLLVSLAAYQAYIGLFHIIDLGQYRVLAVSLANEQFEIARNMPYVDVGVQGSIPLGKIPHIQNLTRGGIPFVVTSIVRNIDLAFDGTIGGAPNDLSPADNKLVEVTVSCTGCRDMTPVTLSGQIAPKNLETASTNGALFVRVFDANGQPIQNASVHVVNVATTTTIVIDDVTDANGMLQLVDVPPGNMAYRITVSKNGYSTDRTYQSGVPSNPFPQKIDATVLVQQVTQISFAIDLLGSFNFASVTPLCTPVGNFHFGLIGSKEIGDSVPKYTSAVTTSVNGIANLPFMEWDTYTAAPTDTVYDLAGINPLNPIILNPGSAQNVQLVVLPKDPKSIVVTVKDTATLLPLSGAMVTLTRSGSSDAQVTGKGFINQTDWSGGTGQADYSNATKYWNSTGVDLTTNPGEIRLSQTFGSYVSMGTLESSTFNTGSPSNFYTLTWSPTDAPLLAGIDSVRFQVASNATVTATTTWNFTGPNGTASTYYATSSSPIHASHNGNQFFRYKAYLSTATATVTPSVSDVAFTFTTSCTPPGQVIFSGLTTGVYRLTVSLAGYSTFDQDITVGLGWEELTIGMAP